MANTIQIKRKTTSGAPTPGDLATGELCLVVPDKQVYVKNNDGTVTLLNGGSGSPAGSSTDVQYNNSGAFAGAVDVHIENNMLTLDANAAPTAPGADKVSLFNYKVGGRNLPGFIGPSGLDNALQTMLARNGISMWLPLGNSTNVTAIGVGNLTYTGTATAHNVANTNRYTLMKKVEILVTTPSGTACAGFRNSVRQYVRGSAAGNGGFHYVCRFGYATGVTIATHRSFVGFSTNTAAPTDVEPSSLLDQFGIAWDAADTNIQFMHNDSSGTCTKIDLGASFPVPSADRTSIYELSMFQAPNSSIIYYALKDLNTGTVASGSVNTNLPSTSALLTPKAYFSAGGTSSVIGMALMCLYIETDY